MVYISDMNECVTLRVNCGSGGWCINTDGSYHCQCRSGWQVDGEKCIGKQHVFEEGKS